ncbi:emp24p/erv25p- protein [Haplosporangium sp. Z 767]|nr:emp24p/erv25p- protein [Haplosporangium sp. Z 11]KAF9192229.1 emp24p/erv25p- protein [Haplosporangium sp. Z 767]
MTINITRWTAAVLMLLSIMPSVFGFYFYLEGSEQKCFTEELPKQTLVTGVYAAEEWNDDKQMFVSNKDVQLEVVVEEMPSGNRVFGQKLSPKGTFKFTSAESGEHNICLFTSTAGWFSSTKIRLTFDMSIRDIMEDATEHDEGTLSELALRVRELNQKVGEIRREQIFLREHEKEFRNQSEKTNGHTVTWTIVQLVVLGIACTAQLRSLRKFFEAKKLV